MTLIFQLLVVFVFHFAEVVLEIVLTHTILAGATILAILFFNARASLHNLLMLFHQLDFEANSRSRFFSHKLHGRAV